ncbi:hypothetical protein LTR74_005187 [Friedmanniomyces endolithicus]|nr:hypothetical protein LTR74_005187 [Friedmanniomyces endolithicus]
MEWNPPHLHGYLGYNCSSLHKTAARNDIELVQTRAPVGASGEAYDGTTYEEVHQDVDGHSLPPYDGGTAAWRMLLSAFVFEALLWGS